MRKHGPTMRDALPAGWQVVDEPPSLLDRSLVNSMVAMRWTVTGWCRANVYRHYARPKGINGINYQLQYTVGSQIIEHRLRIIDYSCSDDAPAGAWCMLRKTPVGPSAPAAAAPPPA